MTINERVSDERIANLIEVLSFYSPEDKHLANNESELASALRELQQYRAAAEPVAWVMKDDLADTDIISTPAYLSFSDAVTKTVGKLIPLYAAPQVTSVPDEMTYEQAREITSKKSFLVDRDSPASLFASGYNACRMDVYLAALAVPAEQLSGNTEQVEHVSAANKLGGWIPVSERMPETMTSVLVTGTWFHHAVSFWDGASWCDLDYEPPVTHWMPLPAAPKQEAV